VRLDIDDQYTNARSPRRATERLFFTGYRRLQPVGDLKKRGSQVPLTKPGLGVCALARESDICLHVIAEFLVAIWG
jgi:hypothetical protein